MSEGSEGFSESGYVPPPISASEILSLRLLMLRDDEDESDESPEADEADDGSWAAGELLMQDESLESDEADETAAGEPPMQDESPDEADETAGELLMQDESLDEADETAGELLMQDESPDEADEMAAGPAGELLRVGLGEPAGPADLGGLGAAGDDMANLDAQPLDDQPLDAYTFIDNLDDLEFLGFDHNGDPVWDAPFAAISLLNFVERAWPFICTEFPRLLGMQIRMWLRPR